MGNWEQGGAWAGGQIEVVLNQLVCNLFWIGVVEHPLVYFAHLERFSSPVLEDFSDSYSNS